MQLSKAELHALRDWLLTHYLEDPLKTKRVAESLGLWQWLRGELDKPLALQLARLDPSYFLEYTMVDPDTGGPIQQQGFQREWQTLMSDNDWSLIGAPRGHGKTIQVVGRQVWNLGTNPNARIKIIGSSDDKAKEILGLIRDLIAKSAAVQDVFPHLKIDGALGDTKDKFFVERPIQQRDPSVEASGWSSTGAGGRADYLICDDVVDPKNALVNPAMREQVKTVMSETWFSLVANSGKVVWICTPYHQMDASHAYKSMGVTRDEMLSGLKPGGTKPWAVWWVPAIQYINVTDEDGNPKTRLKVNDKGEFVLDPETGEHVTEYVQEKKLLWPTYWTEEKLEMRRAIIGNRAFTRQFLLQSMSDDERTFAEIDLKASFDYELRDIGDGVPEHWPTFGGIDLASALSERGAWTVIWTIARHPEDGTLYLKEMVRKKLRFTEILEEIENAFMRHKWRFAYVENNIFQKAVEDAANETLKHIPLQGFTTGAWNKHHQQAGLPGMATAFGKGLFHLPAAKFNSEGFLTDADGSPYATFLEELRSHPGGEYSDTIMALWFAYRAALEGTGEFANSYLDAVAAA